MFGQNRGTPLRAVHVTQRWRVIIGRHATIEANKILY